MKTYLEPPPYRLDRLIRKAQELAGLQQQLTTGLDNNSLDPTTTRPPQIGQKSGETCQDLLQKIGATDEPIITNGRENYSHPLLQATLYRTVMKVRRLEISAWARAYRRSESCK